MNREFLKDTYYGYIVKGDLTGALDYIKSFEDYRELYDKYVAIFEKEEYIHYPIDIELNDIINIYQQYYRDVFFLGIDKEECANKLRDRLIIFLKTEDNSYELSDIEDLIVNIFEQKGFYFMGGKTGGYYGPYVWQSTETKIYEVELPNVNQEYKINLLDGFITKSWIDYLSFGEISTGGWTDGDGIINCIKSSYNFDSENFKVSLLKHEAQHVQDLAKYKNISSKDLEYRAKLVELIYSKERNLLEQFSKEADDSNESNGHSLASSRIIKGVIEKSNLDQTAIIELPIEEIQIISRELFIENENLLRAKY